MRVWSEKSGCYMKDDQGEIHRVVCGEVKVTLDGKSDLAIFEADDEEGWAVVALGETIVSARGTRIQHLVSAPDAPHGVKTEIRRGKVEIGLKPAAGVC